ncbi:MAG: cytochrome b [Hyphomicrobium sp.]
MQIYDSPEGYGLVTRWSHWLMAVAIFALFALGWWMVGLDYYSPYYTSAPAFHKSAGMVLLAWLGLRFIWRLINPRLDDSALSPAERRASAIVHWGFYPLMLVLLVSGYLITTADGRPVDVFGWFAVPSILAYQGLEDSAGLVHEYAAYATMALAGLHTAAALKHHVIDKSRILTRMWSGPPQP